MDNLMSWEVLHCKVFFFLTFRHQSHDFWKLSIKLSLLYILCVNAFFLFITHTCYVNILNRLCEKMTKEHIQNCILKLKIINNSDAFLVTMTTGQGCVHNFIWQNKQLYLHTNNYHNTFIVCNLYFVFSLLLVKLFWANICFLFFFTLIRLKFCTF